MWKAHTKKELMIEVWEWLDCESVGANEISRIQTELFERFGTNAVDSAMIIARALADEGAELRHDEIMGLYVAQASNRPYDAALLNILKIDDLNTALSTIRRLESLRTKYANEADKEGLRLVREAALRCKEFALETADRATVDPILKKATAEIAAWLTIWLQTPTSFEEWVTLRMRSNEFKTTFENSEALQL